MESYIEAESCVTRALTAITTGFISGSIAGAVKANWSDVPPVLRNKPWPALQRTGSIMGQFGVTFALVGLTYASVSCGAEKIRDKKGAVNGLYGGLAAGAALGARVGKPSAGIAGALAFAGSSALMDISGGSFRGNGLIDDGATPRKRIFPYPGKNY